MKKKDSIDSVLSVLLCKSSSFHSVSAVCSHTNTFAFYFSSSTNNEHTEPYLM